VSVERLIAEGVARFADQRSARSVAPLVAALHSSAEAVRTNELDRFSAQLAALTDEQRSTVEALTRGVVQKLLHGPTTEVKAAAGTSKGDRLADSLRDLFDL
jgi:glutamyl-tRNA reductase